MTVFSLEVWLYFQPLNVAVEPGAIFFNFTGARLDGYVQGLEIQPYLQ